MTIPHGTILGGLSTVPNLNRALTAYRDVLKLQVVEQGALSGPLAASWNCPAHWISPPAPRDGALYESRRSATPIGAGGELVECVEVGA